MLGKRKRSLSEPALVVAPLTEANLAALDAASSSPRTSPRTLSRSSASSGAMSSNRSNISTSQLTTILQTHRIYRNRHRPMPTGLRKLVVSVQSPREGPTTPKSARIAKHVPVLQNMSESDLVAHLEEHLLYSPATALGGGEEHVYRSHDQLWNEESVPRPDTTGNTVLREALGRVGKVPRPKPDSCYGYWERSFTSGELDKQRALSSRCRVSDRDPSWPYQILEWKAEEGSPRRGELQAMRDGAAAVHTVRHLFCETGTAQPAEHETAVFSLVVTSKAAEFYVNWRRDDSDEGLSWEMDSIGMGLLERPEDVFQLRSISMNILRWAQGLRLARIKAALSSTLAPPIAPAPDPPLAQPRRLLQSVTITSTHSVAKNMEGYVYFLVVVPIRASFDSHAHTIAVLSRRLLAPTPRATNMLQSGDGEIEIRDEGQADQACACAVAYIHACAYTCAHAHAHARPLCVNRPGKDLDLDNAAATYKRAVAIGEDWLRKRTAQFCILY
ncbi:hypothetical protein W97_07735 [Coniosporium apollinis CBS 100218]|uniref:DUF7924 domain-containing protein n=1 Tax=Coniosporium apollinis (strain CBS 100218) TaxID=1168221 RepID=R7Z394_CONA1|nr:uncharacterized protein W97_07735 [Coniosporium apollinis CBS 100218]EON68411.1 hypothetical protein W97_07735 [Coniosporium apollinis CBS 100218]